MPRTWNLEASAFDVSIATRYSIEEPMRSTNGATADSSSDEMPTKTTPRCLYLAWSSVRCGIDSRQGGHQVAQNSRTYTVLCRGSVTGSPLRNLSGANNVESSLTAEDVIVSCGRCEESKRMLTQLLLGNEFDEAFSDERRPWLFFVVDETTGNTATGPMTGRRRASRPPPVPAEVARGKMPRRN